MCMLVGRQLLNEYMQECKKSYLPYRNVMHELRDGLLPNLACLAGTRKGKGNRRNWVCTLKHEGSVCERERTIGLLQVLSPRTLCSLIPLPPSRTCHAGYPHLRVAFPLSKYLLHFLCWLYVSSTIPDWH